MHFAANVEASLEGPEARRVAVQKKEGKSFKTGPRHESRGKEAKSCADKFLSNNSLEFFF